MEITSIENLIMDDVCKNKDDAYQLAFYDIKNPDIEVKISSNVEQNNCNKYRINDFDWLKKQSLMNLPDVLILKGNVNLSEEQLQLLVDLNIKVHYIDDKILEDEELFKENINQIERKIYKSKSLKYFKIEKEMISKIEEKYSNETDNEKVINGLIDNLLKLIKEKDEVTYSHVTNVSNYVDIFLDGMDEKLSEKEIVFLKRAALVHDIGKLIIPNQILRKKSSLSDNEYAYMKNHVANTSYLFNNKLMREYKDVALCHHERYDGKGYPNGLKGENIPYFARILAVLDTFEALTGKRDYVKKQAQRSLDDVLEILTSNAGTQFDPKAVEIFVKGIMKNPEFTESLTEDKGGILKCA